MTDKKKHLIGLYSYMGSKAKEMDYILKHIPKKTKIFVDCCGGGGSVYINVARNMPKIDMFIFNDYDKNIVSSHRDFYLREPADIIKEAASYPTTREEYDRIGDKFSTRNGDVNLSEYLYLKHFTHKQQLSRLFYNLSTKPVNRDYTEYLFLKKLYAKNKIKITNLSYINILNKMKHIPGAVLYFDPPYTVRGTSNEGYARAEMSDYRVLIDTAKELLEIPTDKRARLLLHVQFDGFIYDNLRNHIKEFYPKRYELAGNPDKINNTPRYNCLVVI
jgi:site-specific DNA-adenine methylase